MNEVLEPGEPNTTDVEVASDVPAEVAELADRAELADPAVNDPAADRPADRPADDLADYSAESPEDRPVEEPAAEQGDQPADEPAQGPVTVGRMVADALRRAGVRWAFTVPGESFLGLIDGLEGAGIHVVATRHEGAASFMAEAHAQLTGRPAACLATRAVGAANLSIGIHTAFADSSPMFALVGQVERAARGREGFQEADLVDTIGGLAKWAAEPRDVA